MIKGAKDPIALKKGFMHYTQLARGMCKTSTQFSREILLDLATYNYTIFKSDKTK